MVSVQFGVLATVNLWPVRAPNTTENGLMVIKPAAATLSLLRLARSAAVNRWEMKVYEIIDACSKGWQLCETEGGLRKGLLIRRVWFEISVKRSLCQNPINRHSSLKVTVKLLFLEKHLDVSAFLNSDKGTVWDTIISQLFGIFNETWINSKLVYWVSSKAAVHNCIQKNKENSEQGSCLPDK